MEAIMACNWFASAGLGSPGNCECCMPGNWAAVDMNGHCANWGSGGRLAGRPVEGTGVDVEGVEAWVE